MPGSALTTARSVPMRPSSSPRCRSAETATSTYAPATINHNLAVLRGLYLDRMAAGEGRVVNPVPESSGRHGLGAHHNPLEPAEHQRRAPFRQKTPAPVAPRYSGSAL
jgi:hypothetical protein